MSKKSKESAKVDDIADETKVEVVDDKPTPSYGLCNVDLAKEIMDSFVAMYRCDCPKCKK